MSAIDQNPAPRLRPASTSRRRALAFLTLASLTVACGNDDQESGWGSDKGKTGSFKMHKTSGDGPGM